MLNNKWNVRHAVTIAKTLNSNVLKISLLLTLRIDCYFLIAGD